MTHGDPPCSICVPARLPTARSGPIRRSYDLAGWQGTDSRTGDHLFVVTAYRKANARAPETFKGAPAPAPVYTPPPTSIPQVPYYPQYPTGPVAWPPPEEATATSNVPSGRQSGGPTSSAMPYYGRGSPMVTGPLGNAPRPEPSDKSYAPYYAGFETRLYAELVDLACIAVFEVVALLLYVWYIGDTNPGDFSAWIGIYWPYFCIAILIFAIYHVVQWSIWGQTLGMYLMGIKVVDRNGRKPGFGRALLRMVCYFPSVLLGGIWGIAFDSTRQALHDKIAETYVVPRKPPTPVPAGLPGYGADEGPTTNDQRRRTTIGPDTEPALGLATLAGAQSYEEVQLRAKQAEQSASRQPVEERSVFREIASLDDTTQTGDLPELPDHAAGETDSPAPARDAMKWWDREDRSPPRPICWPARLRARSTSRCCASVQAPRWAWSGRASSSGRGWSKWRWAWSRASAPTG